MGKDQRLVIEKQVLKAKQLFRARQFKKAGKNFYLAGNLLLKINDFEEAKECYINGAKNYAEIGKFDTAIELFRQSGEACLYANKFLEANQIYKDVMNYIPKLKSEGDRNSNYIIFSGLSYLCLFLKGVPDEGLDYLKRMTKKVDKDFFREHPLITLVSEITLSLKNNQIKYVEKIKEEIGNYKLREAEIKLLKRVLLLINLKLLINSKFTLDKESYTTNEFINLNLDFDTTSLSPIFNDSFYQFELFDFNITKMSINLSDNLSTNIKPSTPITVNVREESHLEFKFKPHFQVDNPIIGPMLITCELNKNLIFLYETKSITPKLISPPATLITSIKNLRPPLIDQTFPLEILIENKSLGEALDVNINVEFPEKLKIMRGTTKKQIYSLRSNEDLKWEINLKPLDAGEYVIKIIIQFMGPDQNKIEETKEFPFSIKL